MAVWVKLILIAALSLTLTEQRSVTLTPSSTGDVSTLVESDPLKNPPLTKNESIPTDKNANPTTLTNDAYVLSLLESFGGDYNGTNIIDSSENEGTSFKPKQKRGIVGGLLNALLALLRTLVFPIPLLGPLLGIVL